MKQQKEKIMNRGKFLGRCYQEADKCFNIPGYELTEEFRKNNKEIRQLQEKC